MQAPCVRIVAVRIDCCDQCQSYFRVRRCGFLRARFIHGQRATRALVERRLRPPSQSCQIRIFSVRLWTACRFLSLAECSLGFLFLALHLQVLFPVAFCKRRFACTSDGVPLGEGKEDFLASSNGPFLSTSFGLLCGWHLTSHAQALRGKERDLPSDRIHRRGFLNRIWMSQPQQFPSNFVCRLVLPSRTAPLRYI